MNNERNLRTSNPEWDGSHPPPAGAPEPCGCDDSKAWQARALAAEEKNRALELALSGAQLGGSSDCGYFNIPRSPSESEPGSPLADMSGFNGGTDVAELAAIDETRQTLDCKLTIETGGGAA